MSTSLLYHLFGVREIVYRRTEYIGNKVIFYGEQAMDRLRCATCGSRHVSLRGKIPRRFRCGGFLNKVMEIVYPVQRIQCHDCGNVRQANIPFADPYKRYTRKFGRYVQDLCRHMTMLDVAEHLDISWDTVKDIEKHYLEKNFARPKLKKLRQIAIDEIAVRKGHRYLTVVLDLKSGAVVFVGDGKGEDALKPFWKRLKASRAKIEAVALDMSPAYEAAVRKNLPQAVMVYDHFHVMKLFNHKLSQLRRELYSQLKDKTEREMLKGVRWLLLKSPGHLREEKGEPERLREALEFNQPLAKAYYLKESLREQFWDCKDYREAEQFLEEWLRMAKACGVRLMVDMAHTLEKHREGLLNYYHYPITTGPLEGTNNKIKTLKRQAYGFRDQEFFKLKIMSLHQCKYALTG